MSDIKKHYWYFTTISSDHLGYTVMCGTSREFPVKDAVEDPNVKGRLILSWVEISREQAIAFGLREETEAKVDNGAITPVKALSEIHERYPLKEYPNITLGMLAGFFSHLDTSYIDKKCYMVDKHGSLNKLMNIAILTNEDMGNQEVFLSFIKATPAECKETNFNNRSNSAKPCSSCGSNKSNGGQCPGGRFDDLPCNMYTTMKCSNCGDNTDNNSNSSCRAEDPDAVCSTWVPMKGKKQGDDK